MESPVHVYQEIDTVDTVDYDVVKSEQGDQLELDISGIRQEWLISGIKCSIPTY